MSPPVVADNISQLRRSDFVGTYTVREAASLIRATTPPPDKPLQLWRAKRSPLSVSSRAIYLWIRLGMDWQEPVAISSRDKIVDFESLIRLRMIAILRSRGFSYAHIREAEKFARRMFQVPQPFVTEQIWTATPDIFARFSGYLISVSKHGQIAMENLEPFLSPAYHGIQFDSSGLAQKWSPYDDVLMDPEIQFGDPCIYGTRIPTETLWSFFKAGDSLEFIARSYGIDVHRVKMAIEWEEIRNAT